MHRKSSRQFFSRLFCCSHFETLKSALFQAFLLQSESEKALTDAEKALADAAPVGRPPNIPRASLAFVGEGNFVLDAEPQDLAWSPKTISVVTWPQFYNQVWNPLGQSRNNVKRITVHAYITVALMPCLFSGSSLRRGAGPGRLLARKKKILCEV